MAILIKNGANINAIDENGYTPRNLAARAGQWRAQEFLKEVINQSNATFSLQTENGPLTLQSVPPSAQTALNSYLSVKCSGIELGARTSLSNNLNKRDTSLSINLEPSIVNSSSHTAVIQNKTQWKAAL
jgi:hypothetical protein